MLQLERLEPTDLMIVPRDLTDDEECIEFGKRKFAKFGKLLARSISMGPFPNSWAQLSPCPKNSINAPSRTDIDLLMRELKASLSQLPPSHILQLH
jgi:hypothetical protein